MAGRKRRSRPAHKSRYQTYSISKRRDKNAIIRLVKYVKNMKNSEFGLYRLVHQYNTPRVKDGLLVALKKLGIEPRKPDPKNDNASTKLPPSTDKPWLSDEPVTS